MEAKGLGWWARADSNCRPLPCQGSAAQQLGAWLLKTLGLQVFNQAHSGPMGGRENLASGTRLAHGLSTLDFQACALRFARLGVSAVTAARSLRQFGEMVRLLAYQDRAREHARQFGEAVRG